MKWKGEHYYFRHTYTNEFRTNSVSALYGRAAALLHNEYENLPEEEAHNDSSNEIHDSIAQSLDGFEDFSPETMEYSAQPLRSEGQGRLQLLESVTESGTERESDGEVQMVVEVKR